MLVLLVAVTIELTLITGFPCLK